MWPPQVYTLLLLMFTFITTATRVCTKCWPEEIFSQPAVGLDFGVNYGRAILHWANGTVEEIATIEADPRYLDVMLDIAGHSRRRWHRHQATLGDEAASDADTMRLSIEKPFQRMFQQLKARIDSALNPHPIAMLGVTYPLFFKSEHQTLIREVVRGEAGLDPSLSYVQTHSAAASAAANQVGVCHCPLSAYSCLTEWWPGDGTVLSIDHSDMLLTIYMYNIYDPHGQRHRAVTDIRKSMPADGIDDGTRTTFWNELAMTLHSLASDVGTQIDHLVLSGTHADNKDFHHAIQSGIGGFPQQRFYSQKIINMESADGEGAWTIQKVAINPVVDPVLAAAQGIANLSWRRTIRMCIDPCSQWRTLPPSVTECMR